MATFRSTQPQIALIMERTYRINKLHLLIIVGQYLIIWNYATSPSLIKVGIYPYGVIGSNTPARQFLFMSAMLA
jgi:hypothetical protein